MIGGPGIQPAGLTLIAETVIDSPDLAAHCLDLLADKGAVGAGASKRYVDRLPEGVLVSEEDPATAGEAS